MTIRELRDYYKQMREAKPGKRPTITLKEFLAGRKLVDIFEARPRKRGARHEVEGRHS